MAASFDGVDDIDRLTAIGGRAAAAPSVGTSVSFNGEEATFQTINPEHVQDHREGVIIRCTDASDKRANNTSYYFTWVTVEKDRYLRANLEQWRTTLWIAGERVGKGDIVKLQAGTYPVMMQISVGSPNGVLYLSFSDVDGAEAEAQHKAKYENYLAQQARWEAEKAAWEAAGSKAIGAEKAIAMGRWGMEDYLTTSLGDRGYPMEGDGYLAFPLTVSLGPYLQAAEQAMGISYQDSTGIGDVLALQLWQTIGAQKINYGPPGWKILDSSGEERAGTWPTLLGATKEEHLPAIKWFYDRAFGMEKGSLELKPRAIKRLRKMRPR